MNGPVTQLLGPPWSERVTRLRLGIAARDVLGRSAAPAGLGLYLEDVPRPWPYPAGPGVVLGEDAGLPGVRRSPAGRFALTFPPRRAQDGSRVLLRIIDRSRRYVPRRFSIPVPDEATVLAAEFAHAADPALPPVPRTFAPALFPGAAYGVAAGATVLRGMVLDDATSVPVPWARVEARTAQPIDVIRDDGNVVPTHPVLGRAHGDDRGEFLLVVGALPRDVVVSATTPMIELLVRVAAGPSPAVFETSASPLQSPRDPVWRLPVEIVSDLAPDDGVTSGVTDPAGYTATVTQKVSCRRGAATRPAVVFRVS
jgi:hypothetical protein